MQHRAEHFRTRQLIERQLERYWADEVAADRRRRRFADQFGGMAQLLDVLLDFERYPVLFALRMNGQDLSTDRGPIWIVYPRDDFPELKNETADTRWIWQLSKLTVE